MSRNTMPPREDTTAAGKRPSYRAVAPTAHPPAPRRSAREVIGDEEDTLPDARVPWPEPPPGLKDRPRDTRSGIALSSTIRPLAARLRSFSLVHFLALAALAMAAFAWFLARTAPPESAGMTAASPNPEDVAASAEAARAAPAAAAPSAVVSTSRPGARAPIDVNSLPVAPAPVLQPPTRLKPSAAKPPASASISPRR